MELSKITPQDRLLISYAIGLLRSDNYFDRYFEILNDLGNGQQHTTQAFYALESELADLCGEGRYTDYNSFREMRRRYAIRVSRRPQTSK